MNLTRPKALLRNISGRQQGQALVETALALPLLLLLFAGCLQLIQLGVAHIVVQVAAYEAGRQAVMDNRAIGQARRVAEEVCRPLGAGRTEITVGSGRTVVVHHLQTLLPIGREIPVRRSCSFLVFRGAEGGN